MVLSAAGATSASAVRDKDAESLARRGAGPGRPGGGIAARGPAGSCTCSVVPSPGGLSTESLPPSLGTSRPGTGRCSCPTRWPGSSSPPHCWCGFGHGDVLAILSPNRPEFAVVFIGGIRAGGVVTTINPLFTTGEIGQQLRDCGARLLVTVPELAGRAAEAAAGSLVREIVTIGDAPGATALARILDAGAGRIEAGGCAAQADPQG